MSTRPSWDKFLDYLSGRELKDHFERVASGRGQGLAEATGGLSAPRGLEEGRGVPSGEDGRDGRDGERGGELGLGEALAKNVPELSGGELQRVAVAVASLKDADMYLFDEPSSFNDVYQRLAVSQADQVDRREGQVRPAGRARHHLPGLCERLRPDRLWGAGRLRDSLRSVPVPDRDQRAPRRVPPAGEHAVQGQGRHLRGITTSVETQQSEEVMASYGATQEDVPRASSWTPSAGEMTAGTIFGAIGANALGQDHIPADARRRGEARLGEVNLGAKIALKPQYLKSDYRGDGPGVLQREGGQGVRRPEPAGVPGDAAEDREALPEERVRPERGRAPEARDRLDVRRARPTSTRSTSPPRSWTSRTGSSSPRRWGGWSRPGGRAR